MMFLELLEKLEKYVCKYDLKDIEITSNRINCVSVLIFKHKSEVIDCIVLQDERFTAPEQPCLREGNP